jgi:hypothetical protein
MSAKCVEIGETTQNNNNDKKQQHTENSNNKDNTNTHARTYTHIPINNSKNSKTNKIIKIKFQTLFQDVKESSFIIFSAHKI